MLSFIYNLEAAHKELVLPTHTPIYDFPNAIEKRAGELTPQTITSFEQAAGGWYYIKSGRPLCPAVGLQSLLPNK